ncbi:MAG: hypothetical protein HC851_15180 [Acaryochloris sp. RU_4_1]|nr:hypothetical protein [Acaryochloris sp. RU_4_1]NJR56759.1 hypothetical protein [Acaryochloris sp. CRU_2_0]
MADEIVCGHATVKEARTRLPRIEHDFYPTAEALTQALLQVVSISGTVLEPCAGDGAIAQLFPNCHTNDLHTQRWDHQLDATLPESWEQFAACEWVVTNPPFNRAPQILPHAYTHVQVGVAFLLRLSYLEPCADRSEWLKTHADRMTHVIVLNPRPKFRSDSRGGDNVTTAWFVWQRDFSWQERGLDCPFHFANWSTSTE